MHCCKSTSSVNLGSYNYFLYWMAPEASFLVNGLSPVSSTPTSVFSSSCQQSIVLSGKMTTYQWRLADVSATDKLALKLRIVIIGHSGCATVSMYYANSNFIERGFTVNAKERTKNEGKRGQKWHIERTRIIQVKGQ